MTLAAAFLFLATPATPDAIEFFPLVKGNRWVYQDTMNEYTDEVGVPVTIGGQPATPVTTILSGKPLDTVFYRVEKDSISIVAYKANEPLPAPIPVFQLGEKNWTFSGVTKWLGGPAPISIKGSSSLGGRQKVLGKEVEVLVVRLNAKIGGENGASINVNQVATYARGIGLVKMEQENVVNKQKQKSKVELLRFEPAALGNP